MKVGCPGLGSYTGLIKELGKFLNWEIIIPLPTEKSTELGNKYLASELMCLPAKVTLGTMIEACKQGATDLVMYDACGICRQKAYWILQQRVLRKLGYTATVHPVRLGLGTPNDLRAIDPSLSYWKSWVAFYKLIRWIFKYEEKEDGLEDTRQVKIGIVGEIYTILDPVVNRDLVKKIRKMGASVHSFLNFSYFISKKFHMRGWMNRADRELLNIAMKKSHEIFPKEIGGHGNEAITFTIYYALKKFDGVIHLMPFPCMPEATVAPVIDDISRDYSIPVMRLILDTQTAEAGLNTRLEAFVDILSRKKRQIKVGVVKSEPQG